MLASASVSAVLCAALLWITRTWIGERIKASIQHEYNQNLASLNAQLKSHGDAVAARLKGDIDREADKLRLASQSFGEAQKAVISKRLGAIEETWEKILQMHDEIPSAIHHLDILLDDEYLTANQNNTFTRHLASLKHEILIVDTIDRSRHLARLRPYIGEYLWALFSTYQAVLLRMIYLVDRSKQDQGKIRWFEDGLIRQHIQSALGEEKLNEMDATKFAKTSWVRDKFIHLILQAMENIVAGKAFSDAAMNQAESMEAQLRASKIAGANN